MFKDDDSVPVYFFFLSAIFGFKNKLFALIVILFSYFTLTMIILYLVILFEVDKTQDKCYTQKLQ